MSDDISIGYSLDASGYTAGMAQIEQANQLANRSMIAVASQAVGLRQVLAQISPSNLKTLGGGTMVKEAAETQQALSGLSAIAATTSVNAGKLQGTMRDLSRTFPIGTQGGRDVVMQFTRMGVAAAGSEGQIAKLATSVVKLSGATGDNIGELAQGMTALSRATGNTSLDPKRFASLGDSLTTISAQSGASATSILQFSKNIAPMAQAAGIGSTGILGISSAFARLGEDGVGASTAVNKMLTDMNKAVQDGSPQLQSYAQILGQTTDQFKEMYKADPTKTLGALTTKIASSGPAGMRDLESIGIEGIRGQRAFQALIGSGGLEEATRTATKAYGNDSTDTASKEAFGGFNDSLTQLTATTRELGDALGTPMLGILTKFSDGLRLGTGVLATMARSEIGQKVAGGVGVLATLAGVVKAALPVLAMLGLGRMALTGGGLKSFFAGAAAGRGDVGLDRDTMLRRQGGRFGDEIVRNSAGITGLNRFGYRAGERLGEEAMYRKAFTEERKRTEFYEKNRATYDAMIPLSPQAQRQQAQRDYTRQQEERAARRARPLTERIGEGYRTAIGYGSGAIQSYFGAGSEFKRQAAMRAEERGRIDMLPGFTDDMSRGKLAYGDARAAGRNPLGASADALKAFHESVREAGKQTGHLKANLAALGESAKASGGLLKQLGKDAWGGVRAGGSGIKGAVGGIDGLLGAVGLGGLVGGLGMAGMSLVTGSISDSQSYKERLKEFDNASISKLTDKYRESAGIATGPTTTFGAVGGSLGKNLVASATNAEQARKVTDQDVAAATGQKAVNQFYGGPENTIAQLKLAKPGGYTPQEMQVIKQDLIVQNPGDRNAVSAIMAQLPEQATMPVAGNLGNQAYQAMAGIGSQPDAGFLRTNLAPSFGGFAGRDLLHFSSVSDQQSALIDTTLGGIEGRYQQQGQDYSANYAQQERLKSVDLALRGAAKSAEETGNKDQFQELSDKVARQLTGDKEITGVSLEQFVKAGGREGEFNIGNELATRAVGERQLAFAGSYRDLQAAQGKAGGQLEAVTADSPLYKTLMGQSSTLAQSFNSRRGSVDTQAMAQALNTPLDPQAMNAATNEFIAAAQRAGKGIGDIAVEAGNMASAMAAGTPAFMALTAAAAKADQRFSASLADLTPSEQAKANRDQAMKIAATPRTNDWSNARADQGQTMVAQQYAADRGKAVSILMQQRQYEIGSGRAEAEYGLQRGYAKTDYKTQVERTQQQFDIGKEYGEADYLRNKKYSEDDYRTQTERAEDDFNTSRFRMQRDFQINSARAEEDYLTQRTRAIRDFNKQMKRQMEDAADSMYDPFKRIQTQPTWDARNLIGNLDEQAKAMRDQMKQLDELRKKGLSDTAIESLGLSKAENAQQVNNLALDANTDPAVVAALNASTEARRKAGEGLYQDPNNKERNRQVQDFATSMADMQKDHMKQVGRAKEDYDKVSADQLADFTKQMNRVHDDFLKQMRRGEAAYNLQLTRNQAALDLSLKNMEHDHTLSLGRMDTAHELSMTHMAEDLKESRTEIAGDLESLSKDVQKAMVGETISWQGKLVDGAQTLVDDLENKVLPRYKSVATQFGINLGAGYTPTASTAPRHHGVLNQPVWDRAEGGSIPGYSPHDKADNIPINATAGEFMQPVATVKHYGEGAMEALRQRKVPKEALAGYATGGLIAPVPGKPGFPWGRYPSGGWHPALDWPVPVGTPVRAPMSGTVVVDGWDTGGFGTHVRMMNSDGTFTILGHLSRESVRIGQPIQAGQVVGLSGNTGNSKGPHVHEEMRTKLWLKSTAFDFTRGMPAGTMSAGVGRGSIPVAELFAGIDMTRGGIYGMLRDDLMRRYAETIGDTSYASSPTDTVGADSSNLSARVRANQATARNLLGRYGFKASQMDALVKLWQHESNWDELAKNPSSGAYGIPQSLPGSKMASVGSDWKANPETQIRWGLGYIKSRYGSPEEAWKRWNARSPHWYDEGGVMHPGQGTYNNASGKPEAVLTSRQWSEISTLAKLAGTMLTGDELRGMHAARGAHITINNNGNVTYDNRNDFGGAQIQVISGDPDEMARKIEAKQIQQRLTATRGVRR